MDRYSLKTGSQSQKVRVLGYNLPAEVKPADLNLGPAVIVKPAESYSGIEIVAEVDVSPNALPGKRDVAFRNATLNGALTVFDKVDYINVLPEAPVAYLGGNSRSPHPKAYCRLQALAYQRGADSKP